MMVGDPRIAVIDVSAIGGNRTRPVYGTDETRVTDIPGSNVEQSRFVRERVRTLSATDVP
jgi:hypothetical protein